MISLFLVRAIAAMALMFVCVSAAELDDEMSSSALSSGPVVSKRENSDPKAGASECDCMVLIGRQGCVHENIVNSLNARRDKDKNFDFEMTIIENANAPGELVIYVPIADPSDYDDGRSFAEAAAKGVKRAIQAGRTAPLLVIPTSKKFPTSELQSLLGAFAKIYQPLFYREANAKDIPLIKLWALAPCYKGDPKELIRLALMYESSRFVARDIAGSDSERMGAPNIEIYVNELFKDSSVKVTVIKDESELEKDYPLLHAVNRAARQVERHQARLIYLDYTPEGDIERTLFLVGKGITYDTGGADIKVGGAMQGMSRDKSGAAAVAGFLHLCNLMRPPGIRVVGAMACVRNSVGPEGYVADDIITSRSGMHIRIINTDAEGRTAMADVLTKCKEDAVGCPDPHIYTIATLTGHAELAVGNSYSIVIDNAVAASKEHARNLVIAGDAVGEPFEISTLRREDFALATSNTGRGECLVQCTAGPSVKQMRGHQLPMAFLTLVSGLDKHGLTSDKPIAYSHLDICGSAHYPPEQPTAVPVLALGQLHIADRVKLTC